MPQSDDQLQPIIDHFENDLRTIRSGRANPGLVEAIPITAYNSTMKLVELASITAPEPRTLVVQPWDKSLLKDIERGLAAAKLDVQPIIEGDHVRLVLPSLTEERRTEYLRLAKEKAEQARISIRHVRDELLKSLRESERSGALSEDAAERDRKAVEENVKTAVVKIEAKVKEKEAELMTL